MIYKLKNKNTGEIKEVEAASAQEAISKISSPTPSPATTLQPPAPKQGEGLMGFVKGMTQPMVDVGRTVANAPLLTGALLAGGAGKGYEKLTGKQSSLDESALEFANKINTPQSAIESYSAQANPGLIPTAAVTGGVKTAGEVLPWVIPTEKLVAGVGKKLAGPLAETSLKKFITPKALQTGLEETMGKVGKVLDNSLKSTTGKIQTKPIIEELQKVGEELVKKGVQEGLPKIENIMARVTSQGKEITAKQAQEIASGFWQDIYGEAGKELVKRGAIGIAEKKAKQISAGQLSSAVKEVLKKEGLTDGTQAYKMFHDLGLVSKEMEKPLKNWWMGGLVGTLTATTGAVGSIPAGAITTLLAMPWTRFAIRKSLSEMFSPTTGTLIKGATIKTVNDLFKGKSD